MEKEFGKIDLAKRFVKSNGEYHQWILEDFAHIKANNKLPEGYEEVD